METLKFELKLKETPVELDGKAHVLRELTGKERDEYMDLVGKQMSFADGKTVGVKKFSGLQSSLLAKSLIDCETGKPVPVATIETFPGSVQSALFKEAQRLSGLDKEKDLNEIKND